MAVDFDVECLCRSLELDTVTASHRFESYDLDRARTHVEALSQPGSGRFGLGLRIENPGLTTTQYAAGDRVPQDGQASESGYYRWNIDDEFGPGT